MTNPLARFSPEILSALRIMSALLFLEHGTRKYFMFPPRLGSGEEHAVVMMSLFGVAGLLELIGGVLLTLGLWTRITAFILSGQCAFIYFIGHAGKDFYPINNGGESAILFCFIFLYIAAAGGGSIGIDAMKKKTA